MTDRKHPLTVKLEQLGVTLEHRFEGTTFEDTPHCKRVPRFNYTINVRRNHRCLQTTYTTGVADAIDPIESLSSSIRASAMSAWRSCPSFDFGHIPRNWRNGRTICDTEFRNAWLVRPEAVPAPKLSDVMSCLLSDYIDGQSFEEWAPELGYDSDSRKAEKTYNECLKISAGLIRLFGSELDALREAAQDY